MNVSSQSWDGATLWRLQELFAVLSGNLSSSETLGALDHWTRHVLLNHASEPI